MSEPNERPIETLLKSAGAKRREQAGAPEMHPATREMLQTEVRQHYGSDPTRASRGYSGFLRWLPRLAVFVVLGVCAWLLWVRDAAEDPLHLALKEEAAPPAFNDQNARRLAEPASAPQAAPAEAASDPAPSSAFKEEPTLLKMVPAAPPERAVHALAQAPEAAGSVVGADYFKSGRQAIYMGTAAVATEDELDGGKDRDAALVALMESPRTRLRVTAADAVALGIQAPGAVFQNFTVFTTGNIVRVVDADGSTYSGTIEPLVAVPSDQLDTRSDTASMATARETLVKDDPGAAVVADLSLVSYSLVAAGTNRSLGQAVRFEGELALTEQQLQLGRNVFSNTIVSAGGAKGKLAPASPDPSTPGRLQGTAVLADGEDVTVDAVPTPR